MKLTITSNTLLDSQSFINDINQVSSDLSICKTLNNIRTEYLGIDVKFRYQYYNHSTIALVP